MSRTASASSVSSATDMLRLTGGAGRAPAPGRRRLDQAQSTDRRVTEEAVDALQDLRFAVLQLKRGSAGHVQHEDAALAIGALAEPDWLTPAGEAGADDGRPLREQLGLGQPASARRRVEQGAQQIGQAPQTASPAHLSGADLPYVPLVRPGAWRS